MSDCSICIEPFNKSTRKKITCGSCKFEVCAHCFETHQSEHSGLYDVQCMSCKQLWDDQFVRENVASAVIKRLTIATKKRLRDEETAFMPETQQYVEYGRAVETVKVEQYVQVIREMKEAEIELARMDIAPGYAQERYKITSKINNKKTEAFYIRSRIMSWRQSNTLSFEFKDIMAEDLFEKRFGREIQNGESSSMVRKINEPTVLCPCPAENCRGFVTRKAHKCGVCDQEVCVKCLTAVTTAETEHVCKETDIQTAEYVLRTSKPCPKCAARIHKIEGCDQMWCTHCNTPFSWRTGLQIIGQAIHNPHYYEWLQQNRRRPAGQPVRQHGIQNCEGLPDVHHVYQHMDIVFLRGQGTAGFSRDIRKIHRKCVHLQDIEINRFNNPANHFAHNLDIRMKWLLGDLTDKGFESVLHKRYKHRLVRRRTVQVYDLYVTLCSDVFHRLLRTNENTEPIRTQFLTEFSEIEQYTDTCFEKLEKIYKVKMPRI